MMIRDDDYVRWIEAVLLDITCRCLRYRRGRETTDHSPADPEFVALMKTSVARGKLFSSCKAAVLDACAMEPWADNQSYWDSTRLGRQFNNG